MNGVSVDVLSILSYTYTVALLLYIQYEVCNTERKTLQKFAWKYLVIDEAHRLKNEASLFSKVVRTLHTQHRFC